MTDPRLAEGGEFWRRVPCASGQKLGECLRPGIAATGELLVLAEQPLVAAVQFFRGASGY